MALLVGTIPSQEQAVKEWNEYNAAKKDLVDEFEAEVDKIDALYDDQDFDEAMKELESHPRFARHCMEMRRLIENMREADRQAASKPGNLSLVDNYSTIMIDHRNPLNPRYEKSRGKVFDMSPRHEARRRSTVKFTNNPIGKAE